MVDLLSKNTLEILELIENGEISSSESVNFFLERTHSINDNINAFVSINDGIRRNFDKQRQFPKYSIKSLSGLAIGIKDNIVTSFMKTTCASNFLKNWNPPYNATVVDRLISAGACIIGKTNLDEFAMGSSTEYSIFGPTLNPHNLNLVPGGSSGGSAAAVAAGMVPVSLGSDTGGSVRQPAAFCGIVGFKPSYGAISRYGLIAFASSMDQIGIMTKDVESILPVFQVLSGKDLHDPLTLDGKRALKPNENIDLGKIRIGLIEESLAPIISPDIRDLFGRYIDNIPCKIEPVSLPSLEYSLAVYHIISSAEAASNLARYDGIIYGKSIESTNDIEELYFKNRELGFGSEVKRRILLGNFVLSRNHREKYIFKAMKIRNAIKRDFENAFQKYDILISPTTPTFAFEIGEKCENPLEMYKSDINTIPANLAGLPAISFPIKSKSPDRFGSIQLVGPYNSDFRLLKLASAIEASCN